MKRNVFLVFLAALLALLLPLGAMAEEDEELSLPELLEVEEIDLDAISYGGVAWDFPVALADMEPDLVRLANKHYLLEKDFVVKPLVTAVQRKADKQDNNTNNGLLRAKKAGTLQLTEICYNALVEMSEAARAEGYKLYLKSAYRSYQTQSTMYKNRLAKNNGKDDGWVARPGSSDHQTGLGCDVIPGNWQDKSGMNSKMASEPECVWMAQHCQEFGFIIRYPEDKVAITEINYEPWHLRYVGIPAATYIMDNGLCLEEFVEELQDAIARFLADGGNPTLVEPFIQTPADE